MVVAALLAVLAEETFTHQRAIVGEIVDSLEVVLFAFLKAVGIDETVRAGVVGRIDVDELDLAEVRLLQDLEHFQVLAFDEHVLRLIEVHRLVALGPERGGGRCLQHFVGVALAGPGQGIAFAAFDDSGFTQHPFEGSQVELAFRKCLGDERGQLRAALVGKFGGCGQVGIVLRVAHVLSYVFSAICAAI